jgi:hypothetical protein
MRTIREVFDYCVAAHDADQKKAVSKICPDASVVVWDHGEYGQAIGVCGAKIHDEPAVLLCFQGTRGTWKDWIRNFEIKSDANGVDHGFRQEFLMYKTEIDAWLPSIPHGAKVYTTGHSQGGPTAAQVSEYIWDQYEVPNSCITFGSPLWCTKTARNRYDIKSINLTNVTNPMDLVTKVDPKAERPGKEFQLRAPWWHVFVPAFLIVEHTIEAYRRDIIRTEKAIGGD